MLCDAYPDECELIRFFLALGLAMSFLSWALATLFRVAFNPDDDDEPPPLPSGSQRQRPNSPDSSRQNSPDSSPRTSDDANSGLPRSVKGSKRRRAGGKGEWEQLKDLQDKRYSCHTLPNNGSYFFTMRSNFDSVSHSLPLSTENVAPIPKSSILDVSPPLLSINN